MTERLILPAMYSEASGVQLRYLGVELGCLSVMWNALYVHQRYHGLIANVPDTAFDDWTRSLSSVIGRFGFAVVASVENADVGFCAGRIRPMPSYYGGGYAGYISDVFVFESARGLGVGKLLVDSGVRWFRERDVQRIELNVVWKNEQALRFYRRLGWVEDVVQLVKMD